MSCHVSTGFFFSSRRRHTRSDRDWSSDVCSSDLSQDLLDDGKVYHSFLGILGAQHFEVAEDGARIFSGVVIQELYGPANDIYAIGKAGALPGDIIKKVNGKNIKTLDGLISLLRSKKAGDEISIEITRNGQAIILEFLLDLRPSDV